MWNNNVGPNAGFQLPVQMQPFQPVLNQQMMQLLFQHIMMRQMQRGFAGQQGFGGANAPFGGGAQGIGGANAPFGGGAQGVGGANAPFGGGAQGVGGANAPMQALNPIQRQQLGQAIQQFNNQLRTVLRGLLQNGFPPGALPPHLRQFAQGPQAGGANAPFGAQNGGAFGLQNGGAINDKWLAQHGKYKRKDGNIQINGGKWKGATAQHLGGGKYNVIKDGKQYTWQNKVKKDKVASPLAFDLNGNGKVDTTKIGKAFDINGDGKIDKSAWVGKGDGVLAFNGKLDEDGKAGSDGRELFGNNTAFVGRDGKVQKGFANGFDALRAFAGDKLGADAVEKGYLNKKDIAALEKHGLTMNVNGKNQGLGELGVDRIDLGYKEAGKNADANGNQHRQVGAGFSHNGERAAVNDVWFRYE